MKDVVLIVDDDKELSDTLALMLNELGYDTAICSDGLEARSYLETEAKPQAVLLDIMMPRLSGMALLKELKNSKDSNAVPVILLSAISDDESIIKGYQEGADYYMTKPCTLAQLSYAMNLLIGEGEYALAS